jgi:potassium-transporting ATPase KdpC subunit
MTIVTGVLYPAVITVAGRFAFPWQSKGCLIRRGPAVIGSLLLAQPTSGHGYFSPRPSAGNYATVPSAASNRAVTSAVLRDSMNARTEYWKKTIGKPPSDLVFSSGSGLDPHISPDAALFQADRIARARGFSEQKAKEIREMIFRRIERPEFGALGEARVNVLLLNCDLDGIAISRAK